MTDQIKVDRLAGILASNPDKRFHRADMADRLSTPEVFIDLRDMTRLWPQVEASVGRRNRDLFVVRPIGRLRYGVAAVTDPFPAMLSLTYREKTIVTRLTNDANSHLLNRIAATGGLTGEAAARQLRRISAYLASVESDHLDLFELDALATEAYTRLPWAVFSEARTYARDLVPNAAVRTA